ncbi:MAG: pH regulation protein F [Sandaracinus sp.]|nr:pH regulation protein F [Sandaracinus sp.]|tara:strand:+ start:4535 stop:4867 length:333 start_codon:yes stop_codon:yes gene_type:complete
MPAWSHLVFWGASIAIVVTMALALLRSIVGPTTYDRILALNSFGTKTVLLIAVAGFLTGRPEWLDLAIVYALINFIGTLAVLRFSKYGSLAAEAPLDEGEAPERPPEAST